VHHTILSLGITQQGLGTVILLIRHQNTAHSIAVNRRHLIVTNVNALSIRTNGGIIATRQLMRQFIATQQMIKQHLSQLR